MPTTPIVPRIYPSGCYADPIVRDAVAHLEACAVDCERAQSDVRTALSGASGLRCTDDGAPQRAYRAAMARHDAALRAVVDALAR